MATLQLGEEVAHALIRNLAGNDNIPDRNSIRGWAPSLWLGWVDGVEKGFVIIGES
jgi:hypothetical protein